MHEWNYLEFSLRLEDCETASGILWWLATKGIEERSLKIGRIRFKAYFDSNVDIQEVATSFQLACRRAGISLGALALKCQKEMDWLKMWHGKIKPFRVGERFYIIPHLETPGPLPENRFVIWLEPGMAFGTGTHETTRMCLEALEQNVLVNRKLLDVGTGSGILSIAAVRLGCRRVVACDVDPEAIRIARSNSVTNQCDREIEWVVGDLRKVRYGRFDLVVANLTAKVIVEELKELSERLGAGGVLILSGILDSQFSLIRSTLRNTGLKGPRVRRKGEWVCLTATKP
jgi:ribosomal protein L11 methyltransferase